MEAVRMPIRWLVKDEEGQTFFFYKACDLAVLLGFSSRRRGILHSAISKSSPRGEHCNVDNKTFLLRVTALSTRRLA